VTATIPRVRVATRVGSLLVDTYVNANVLQLILARQPRRKTRLSLSARRSIYLHGLFSDVSQPTPGLRKRLLLIDESLLELYVVQGLDPGSTTVVDPSP
jgi:hypothetical protein